MSHPNGAHTDPSKRHEFMLLFDVVNGNPNGDPDADNAPRTDPETMLGLVSDVALKRKVRDYLALTRGTPIFVQSKTALNTLIKEAADAKGVKGNKKVASDDLRLEMCRRFYDIRMFGAVLSTGDYNAGQVRGPVQITFARSVDRVLPLEVAITRQGRTTEERMETGGTEMGRKALVPYGLYRAHGYFNPFLAQQTGVSETDLEALWEAVTNLFDFDRSAARGEMAVRRLYVFSHASGKGNAPAHRLFDLVKTPKLDGTPRQFSDYDGTIMAPEVAVGEAIPLEPLGFPGVTLTRLV